MNTVKVKVVRIYMTESSGMMKIVLNYLHHEVKVRGVSVFRAVSGFGDSGERSSSLVDLSLSLPIAIEFFDETEKADKAIKHLSTMIKPEHMVFWPAESNIKEEIMNG